MGALGACRALCGELQEPSAAGVSVAPISSFPSCESPDLHASRSCLRAPPLRQIFGPFEGGAFLRAEFDAVVCGEPGSASCFPERSGCADSCPGGRGESRPGDSRSQKNARGAREQTGEGSVARCPGPCWSRSLPSAPSPSPLPTSPSAPHDFWEIQIFGGLGPDADKQPLPPLFAGVRLVSRACCKAFVECVHVAADILSRFLCFG